MLDTTMVTELLREGVWVAVKLCAPLLVLSMAVGVLLAIFQAVTQIHEQTLSGGRGLDDADPAGLRPEAL